MTKPRHLTIGQLAKRTCSTTRTIRFYEQLGLIQAAERSSGGFRLFEESTIADVQCIQDLKLAGLSLEDVALLRKPTDWDRVTPERSATLDKAFANQQEAIRDRIRRLEELLQSLEKARQKIRGCQECSKQTDRSGCLDCLGGKDDDLPRVLGTILR
ncbi:MAG: MerR family DNA-binding transcriptional regulator [Planctomycetota bacterium]